MANNLGASPSPPLLVVKQVVFGRGSIVCPLTSLNGVVVGQADLSLAITVILEEDATSEGHQVLGQETESGSTCCSNLNS